MSFWIGSVTSHTFTFIPASTRPSFTQNAMNSRFPASPRISTWSYEPGGAHPEYSQNRCPHLVNSGSKAVGQWLAGEVRRIVDTSAG